MAILGETSETVLKLKILSSRLIKSNYQEQSSSGEQCQHMHMLESCEIHTLYPFKVKLPHS